jgi:hypothetical protein
MHAIYAHDGRDGMTRARIGICSRVDCGGLGGTFGNAARDVVRKTASSSSMRHRRARRRDRDFRTPGLLYGTRCSSDENARREFFLNRQGWPANRIPPGNNG